MSKTATCSFIGCPFAAQMGGASAGRFSAWATFCNLVLVAGVLSTLVYFFFSKEHKGAIGATARMGIWYLMISFGAAYGFTVMSRISLLIGRLHFLMFDWIGGMFR